MPSAVCEESAPLFPFEALQRAVCLLIQVRVVRQQLQRGSPDMPLSSHVQQLLQGCPEVFPGQPTDRISPACPGSALRSSPRWTWLKHLPREVSRRHRSQVTIPPPMSLLSSSPVSEAKSSRPVTETHPGRLYSRSCPFNRFPKLMGVDEGWSVD